MTSKNEMRNASYEEMSGGNGNLAGQCDVPYYNPPAQNEFEKSKWNSNGYDQSRMK